MQKIDFELRGDYIALDALLKATGLAESGGTAKQMIVGGDVLGRAAAVCKTSCFEQRVQCDVVPA